jgi:hypothetical protein
LGGDGFACIDGALKGRGDDAVEDRNHLRASAVRTIRNSFRALCNLLRRKSGFCSRGSFDSSHLRKPRSR